MPADLINTEIWNVHFYRPVFAYVEHCALHSCISRFRKNEIQVPLNQLWSRFRRIRSSLDIVYRNFSIFDTQPFYVLSSKVTLWRFYLP